jgi:hypothetical protein
MTAEIGILNREAIAMAADSAATMRTSNRQKILSSANKIFSLSKCHPVGIMIYGDAGFMGTPWEIIIKLYRQKLGKKCFEYLEEYAHDFVNFIKQEKQFYPDDVQLDFISDNIYGYFISIQNEIENEIEIEIKNNANNTITEVEAEKIITKILKDHYDFWNKAKAITSNSSKAVTSFRTKYQKTINKIKNDVFKKLTPRQSKYLTDIAINLFIKDRFPSSGISGVVIAGFGEKQIFPSIIPIIFEGIANNILKYKINKDKDHFISQSNSALIIPFAQSEMVYSFMEGVNPNYNQVIIDLLTKTINDYPQIILDKLSISEKKKKKIISEILKENPTLIDKTIEKLDKYRQEQFAEPIIEIVNVLSKNELAEMAESLVNLTVFKKRMTSTEDETVGGPIDVAVISKGDGLIWIKRKHYFDPKLNQGFFSNYFNFEPNEKEYEKGKRD